MSWVSPTSHSDPDSAWVSETNAYDGDTGTFATCAILKASWGKYLELIRAAISCDKVRYFISSFTHANIDQISVDVYYSGGWHNIYEGAFTEEEWIEKAIGSTQTVTQARVKFYNSDADWSRSVYLNELEFNEIAAAGRSFGFIIG